MPGARRAGDVFRFIEALPPADIHHLTRGKPVLFLAPHADDESIGCGGAIAAGCATGEDLHVLILTDGAASHPGSSIYPAARLAALRMEEARAAVAELGLGNDRIGFLGLPDGAAGRDRARLREALDWTVRYADRHRIDLICTTWRHDPHPDHKTSYLIARTATRRLGIRLLQFPVWGWTLPPERWIAAPRIAGFRLDIEPFLPAKRRAIACHRSQTTELITDSPHGFTLPASLLRLHDRPFEAFLEAG